MIVFSNRHLFVHCGSGNDESKVTQFNQSKKTFNDSDIVKSELKRSNGQVELHSDNDKASTLNQSYVTFNDSDKSIEHQNQDINQKNLYVIPEQEESLEDKTVISHQQNVTNDNKIVSKRQLNNHQDDFQLNSTRSVQAMPQSNNDTKLQEHKFRSTRVVQDRTQQQNNYPTVNEYSILSKQNCTFKHNQQGNIGTLIKKENSTISNINNVQRYNIVNNKSSIKSSTSEEDTSVNETQESNDSQNPEYKGYNTEDNIVKINASEYKSDDQNEQSNNKIVALGVTGVTTLAGGLLLVALNKNNNSKKNNNGKNGLKKNKNNNRYKRRKSI